MALNLDDHYPRAFVAELVEVKPHVVGMWAVRGWLDENGVRHHLRYKLDRHGRRLYHYGDVLTARRHTDANPRSHRAAA